MKQHVGDEIRRIMAEMPAELVKALQDAQAEHNITEYEARWWGFMMFARNDAYEGDEFKVPIGGMNDVFHQTFIGYVLQDRESRKRHGLPMPAWPYA